MLFLIFIVFIIVKNEPISDLMEGTIWMSSGWKKTDSSPMNNKQICNDDTASGPFLFVNENVWKQFTNLPPHYKLLLSLDILETQYWSGLMNQVSVAIDSSILYTASSISSLTFTTPSSFCNLNYIIYEFDQQLLTIQQTLLHSGDTLKISIESSFKCSLLSLNTLCEELMLKNLVLLPFTCHSTCLTCTGPDDNNCLTCPYGVPTNGQCYCQIGDYSHEYTCVSTCPLYYVSNQYQQCILECSLQCVQCQQNKCIQCGAGYYNHLGNCVAICPLNSIQSGLNCQDYSELSTYGSLYIGTHFTEFDVDVTVEVSKFAFTQTLGYSKLTGQLYSVYNKEYLLGGFGVWSEGKFTITYTLLPAHNNIRIYLTAFIIDNWNNKQFIIKLDNQIILQNTYTSSSFTSNLFYGNEKDFIDNISLTVPHLLSSATLTFETTLTVSSFQASIALQSIQVLVDYCDHNCQVCSSTSCTTCAGSYQLIHNQCGMCDGTTNRDSSCFCLGGYYDDGISATCQQCRVECESCNTSSDCLTCRIGSNLIILPNCMNCITGYYFDSGYCHECNPSCKTCFGSGVQDCLTCEQNQILTASNECQYCNANQFFENSACIDCSYNCYSCQNLDSCATCASGRINAPLCECEIGYFENSEQICQICSNLCQSCNLRLDNCLVCAANREIALGCQCPANSQQNTDSVWCTNCSTAVLDINYSNDLTKLIIDFRQQTNGVYSDCSLVFQDNTLIKLGLNPVCLITIQTITVILGDNATTTYGDIINIKSLLIQFQGCQNFITTFINNFIQYPENPPLPQIILSDKSVTLSDCQTHYKKITLLSQINDGNRGMKFYEWALIKSSQQDVNITLFLEYLNSKLNSTSITYFLFPHDILHANTTLILQLKFYNFLLSEGSSLITIYQSSDAATLQIEQQLTPYFISQPIILKLTLNVCQQYLHYNLQSFAKASITFQNIKDSISLYFNNSSTYKIEQNNTSLIGSFDFIAVVSTAEEKYLTQNQVVIMVKSEEPRLILQAESGSYASYKQQIVVQSQISTKQNMNINVKWECIDISLPTNCLSGDSSKLIFQDSPTLSLSPFTFEPYKVILINAIYGDLKEQIQIMITETDVPKLEVEVHPDVSTGYINFYDQLYLKFKYSEINANPDSLLYSCIISNTNNVTKQFKFDYLELQFQLWNYFQVQELTTLIRLRVNIYNPEYFMPSSVSIKLQINIPPRYCSVFVTPSEGEAILTDFHINVENCIDDNTPLQYRLILYQNDSDFNYDTLRGQIQKGVMLYDYSYDNIFLTKLTGNGSIYIMIQAKDTLNGINNFSATVNITQVQQNLTQSIINSDQLIDSIVLTLHLQYQSKVDIEEYENLLIKKSDIFSACNCQQFQILQTLLLNYSQFSISLINTRLYSALNRLQEINTTVAILNQSDYDKYQHTVQEFQKFILFEETINLANYISQLYQMNLNANTSSSRLLLEQANQLENNQLVISSVNSISDIQLQNQKINSKILMLQTNFFNISTQKTTAKLLKSVLGNSLLEQQPVQSVENDQNQPLDNQTYQYKMAQYSTNPYFFDPELQSINTNKSNYPLYSPEVIFLHNQSAIENLSSPIRYSFQKNSSSIVECATKVQNGWKVDACQIIDKGDTVICVCQEISPVTILGAFEQLVQEASNFFTLKTIKNILNYQYQTVIFTYIMFLDTTLFVWFLYYGQRLDQLHSEQSQFSAKVAPIDWDVILDKPKSHIEQIGTIDSDYKVTSTRKLNDRRLTQKKTIFSMDSQHTIEEKHLKKSDSEFFTRALSSKRNLALTQNLYSIKKIDETVLENSPKSKQSSPNCQIEGQNQERSERVQITPEKIDPLHHDVITKKVSLLKGYSQFIQINHKILSLYYLYDKDYSRVYRTVNLFISVLGQISILTFFGKIINFNTIIALSIIQTVFGFVFRKLLSIFLHTEKRCLNYIGFNLALLSVLFFIFVILGSVAKYKSLMEATMWGAAYLTSFVLEQLIYSNLQFICIFTIVVKYGKQESVQVTITSYSQSYLKYLLNDKVHQKVFGV